MCSSKDSFAPLAQDGRTTDLSLQTPKQLISHYYKLVMLSLPNLMSTHTLHSYSGLLWTPLHRNASDFPHDHTSSLSPKRLGSLSFSSEKPGSTLRTWTTARGLTSSNLFSVHGDREHLFHSNLPMTTASCSVCRIALIAKALSTVPTTWTCHCERLTWWRHQILSSSTWGRSRPLSSGWCEAILGHHSEELAQVRATICQHRSLEDWSTGRANCAANMWSWVWLGNRWSSSDPRMPRATARYHDPYAWWPSASRMPTFSLTSFETALRTTTPNRAAGLDPVPAGLHHDHAPVIAKLNCSVLLKIHLWCAEPLQFKGGIMCLIHKKGSIETASNYRGILLLGSFAKRIHSIMRASLMTTLAPHRAEGQLGGFANQMVQFGFHSVISWTHVLEAQGLSTAVLYLDLTSAFHHLIREFVLGVTNEDDFLQIIADLHAAGHPIDAFQRGQQLIGALSSFGCDQRILSILQDIHSSGYMVHSIQIRSSPHKNRGLDRGPPSQTPYSMRPWRKSSQRSAAGLNRMRRSVLSCADLIFLHWQLFGQMMWRSHGPLKGPRNSYQQFANLSNISMEFSQPRLHHQLWPEQDQRCDQLPRESSACDAYSIPTSTTTRCWMWPLPRAYHMAPFQAYVQTSWLHLCGLAINWCGAEELYWTGPTGYSYHWEAHSLQSTSWSTFTPLSGPGGNQTLLWFGNLAHSHSAPDADLAHSSCEHAEESNAHWSDASPRECQDLGANWYFGCEGFACIGSPTICAQALHRGPWVPSASCSCWTL